MNTKRFEEILNALKEETNDSPLFLNFLGRKR